MRLFTALVLATSLHVTAVLADEVSGTIVAYDRLANLLVMDDKSIWALSPTALVPADLKAGDVVTLTFTSGGENGANAATALVRQGD